MISEALNYKLELLKVEIQTINSAILDKDQTARQIKQWAVTLWLGATGFAGAEHISTPTVQSTLWAAATLCIPIAFLMLELHNKRTQRKFIWRAGKIHRFINDLDYSLTDAIEKDNVDEFRIYDPAGENWRRDISGEESESFEKFISPAELIKNPTVFLLYVSLVLFSGFLMISPWAIKFLNL